jgi:four helix bundle protein
MKKTNFENLQVYQLAEKLADEIWVIVLRWDYFARDTVGKQIVRAADGIGANIAEGTGRGTALDNRRFVRMARGSLYESKHWLRRAYKRGLLTKQQVDEVKPIIAELAPKLNGYYRYLDAAATVSRTPSVATFRCQSTKHKVQSTKHEELRPETNDRITQHLKTLWRGSGQRSNQHQG